jgi:RNA polymerase sigma-70 factor (ECF subfamily)
VSGCSRTFHLATIGNLSALLPQCTGEVEDAGLLERTRRGDADAFSSLFARYQGPIFRYAAHMCGRDAADDVVQETFLAILRPSGRYDPARGTVANYLFGIARHVLLARMSSREVTGMDAENDESLGAAIDEPTVLDSLTRAETIEAVRIAIGSLPPLYREVLVLCELQELSYVDAAGIVECPVGTVRSRLHRARALLLTKLSALHSPAGLRKQCR